MDIERFIADLTGGNHLAWKTAGAGLVLGLAGLQVALAARFWSGRGRTVLHRWNGRVLLVLTVVIAYVCIFTEAGSTEGRPFLHSIAGTVLFLLLFAKFHALHLSRDPRAGDRLPLLGCLLFLGYVAVWALSALDYVTAPGIGASGALVAWVWGTSGAGAVLGLLGIGSFLARRRSRGRASSVAAA